MDRLGRGVARPQHPMAPPGMRYAYKGALELGVASARKTGRPPRCRAPSPCSLMNLQHTGLERSSPRRTGTALQRLRTAFSASRHFPNRPAVVVGGEALSYPHLGQRVAHPTARQNELHSAGQAIVVVLARRSARAYEGLLAGPVSGKGYSPS